MAADTNGLDQLIACFENLTRDNLPQLVACYAADAYFKDPFNEVTGQAAIERIFRHMFDQVADPFFTVSECVREENAALLVWQFHFGPTLRRKIIRGASHLKFNNQGRVSFHRDYWDAAEELYAKLPVLGGLMRALARLLRA
jgi:hypothetical protein